MEKLTVLIRTCLYRLPYAYRLKLLVEAMLTDEVYILNTGASVDYSQRSILQLSNALSSYEIGDFVLVLEDDAVFGPRANSHLQEFIEGGLEFVWLTIPNSKVLKEGIPCGKGISKYKAEVLNYSGAVWFSKDLLKGFIAHYCLHHLDLQEVTFDLSLSAFVSRRYEGYIPFKEGLFATDHSLPSSVLNLDVYTGERVEVEASVLDLGFNFKVCLKEIEDVRVKDCFSSDSHIVEHQPRSEGEGD